MKRCILPVILACFGPLLLWAQQSPIGILEYFDDEKELNILDDNGFEVEFYIGMGINPGDRISTGNTAVELRFEPNGSIIRLAPRTQFIVETLQGRNEATTHRVRIVHGKFRMVTAQYADQTPNYEVVTPSGVATVRGADFGILVVPDDDNAGGDEGAPGESSAPLEELFIFDGEVVFTMSATEESIFVSGDQRVDIRSEQFLPVAMDEAITADRMRNLEFVRLDPRSVPGTTTRKQPEVVDVTPPPQPPTPEQQPDEPGPLERILNRLGEVSRLEAGSITLNKQTYANIVYQPLISVGDLKMAFYVPVTFQNDLFRSESWYRPGGNNEWSFGSDHDWSRNTQKALNDLVTDVAMKIRYLEYGDRGDPFFVKAGEVSPFTLGQGLLMHRYTNDVDFPAVRKVGFQSGFDFTQWGVELVIDDLSAPEIYGSRIFFRPAAPLIPAAVGISAITDLDPASKYSLQDGDPLFLNVAMDIEVPILDRDTFSLIGFAEGGAFVPYLREEATVGSESASAGLKTSALVDFSSGDLKNAGWTIGTRGTITDFDYRLEARGYDGVFRPAFYGSTYERLRGMYATETVNYLVNTANPAYQYQYFAVAGELTTHIGENLLLSGAYTWPWEIDDGKWSGGTDDEISVGIIARDGLLPLGITAGVEYGRTHFAATAAGWDGYEDAHLFDAYSRLDTFVRYPLSPIVDFEARLSTAAVRDGEGEIVYDSRNAPKMAPILAIQTRIGF